MNMELLDVVTTWSMKRRCDMDFCLSVTKFTVGLVFHFTICFNSSAERVEWIRERQREPVEFIVVFCDREQLVKEYSAVLN